MFYYVVHRGEIYGPMFLEAAGKWCDTLNFLFPTRYPDSRATVRDGLGRYVN